MKSRHPLVAIEWDDASTLTLGWQQDAEIKPVPQIAYTVGFLLKKTKDHLVVHSTFDAESATNHHFQIPTRMVRRMAVMFPKGADLCPQASPAVAKTSS